MIANQALRIFMLLVVAAFVAEAHAQSKKDILGFYPGMTKSDFDKQLVEFSKGDCTPFWNSSSCKLKLGKLNFNFTKENLLQDVAYKFTSGSEPEEIVGQISSEYKVKPPVTKSVREAIGKARVGQRVAMGQSLAVILAAQIADWELSNKDRLYLNLETVNGNEFTLVLIRPSFIEAQKAETQKIQDAKERELKSINPKPKF